MSEERKILRKNRDDVEKEIKNAVASANHLIETLPSQREIFFGSTMLFLAGGLRLFIEYREGMPLDSDPVVSAAAEGATQVGVFCFTVIQAMSMRIRLNEHNKIDQLRQEWQEIKQRMRKLQAPAMQFLFGVHESPDRDRKSIVKTEEEKKSLLLYEDKREAKNFLYLLHTGDDCLVRHILEFSDHLDPIIPKNKP